MVSNCNQFLNTINVQLFILKSFISLFIDIPGPLGNGFSLRISISYLGCGISNQIKLSNLKSASQATDITCVYS